MQKIFLMMLLVAGCGSGPEIDKCTGGLGITGQYGCSGTWDCDTGVRTLQCDEATPLTCHCIEGSTTTRTFMPAALTCGEYYGSTQYGISRINKDCGWNLPPK